MAKTGKAAAPRTVAEPEIIDQDGLQLATMFGDEEGAMALQAVDAFRSFIGGLAGFVTKALALEAKAAETLVRAGELKPPKTAAEDEQLQTFIRSANATRKEVEDTWTICSAVHQFHRKLTAKRDKPTKALEQATGIAQQLHNRFVEDEKRRAREEEDRQRREAEERARLDRERELAEAEQKALEHEASSPVLSEREQIFVDLVASGVAPSQAAFRAGYKDTTRGLKMLDAPKVKAAIAAKQEAAAVRRQAEAKRQEPLQVEHVEVKPQISRAAGAVDRTTHSAEILDEAKLIAACVAGGYGIPQDILQVNPAKVNEYARSLQQRIDLWPGVRYKKTTKTI